MMVCSKKRREGVGGGMWEPGPRLADTNGVLNQERLLGLGLSLKWSSGSLKMPGT